MGAVTLNLDFSKVNPKQKLALEDKHKYIGYGGARGGGKMLVCKDKSDTSRLLFCRDKNIDCQTVVSLS